MPDTKHTPGPWTQGKHTECDAYYVLGNEAGEGQRELAVVYMGDVAERYANLKLMLAAPDLLEAAQFALEIIETHLLELSDGSMATRLRDAIKKAEAR